MPGGVVPVLWLLRRSVKTCSDLETDVVLLCGFTVVVVEWTSEIAGWFVVRLDGFESFLPIPRPIPEYP